MIDEKRREWMRTRVAGVVMMDAWFEPIDSTLLAYHPIEVPLLVIHSSIVSSLVQLLSMS